MLPFCLVSSAPLADGTAQGLTSNWDSAPNGKTPEANRGLSVDAQKGVGWAWMGIQGMGGPWDDDGHLGVCRGSANLVMP